MIYINLECNIIMECWLHVCVIENVRCGRRGVKVDFSGVLMSSLRTDTGEILSYLSKSILQIIIDY